MTFPRRARGQTSLEYLLLLTVVAVIVIASFSKGALLDQIQATSRNYFNSVSEVIAGKNPVPINGGWCPVTCPAAGSYGFNVMYRSCECPAPAFGGQPCSGNGQCGPDQSCNGAQVTCSDVNACGPCPTGQICIGGGCACPLDVNGQTFNQYCSSLIKGSSPDALCQNCDCPSTQFLAGTKCNNCPYGYTYYTDPVTKKAKCIPLKCGDNMTITAPSGGGTSCECDLGAYFNGNSCSYCQTGYYYNGTACVSCPTGEVYDPVSAICKLGTCKGKNMYWDTDPTSPQYLSCACEAGTGYDNISKGCLNNYDCDATTYLPNATPCPSTKTTNIPGRSLSSVKWTKVANLSACAADAPCQSYKNTCDKSALPANSKACPTPKPVLPMPATPPSWSLVYACDNTQLCEATCKSGQNYGLECNGTSTNNNGTEECNGTMQCQSMYICPLPLPKGALPCPKNMDASNFPPNVPMGAVYSSSKTQLVAQESDCKENVPCEAFIVPAVTTCTAGSGCSGKQCGADACGAANGCGVCGQGEACNASGQCICTQPGICPAGHNCGPDTCGNANGCNPKAPSSACSSNQTCNSGQCECTPGVCPFVNGVQAQCGPDTCNIPYGCNGYNACGTGKVCDSYTGQCTVCARPGVCPQTNGVTHTCGPDTCGIENGCQMMPCAAGSICDLNAGDTTFGQCVCKPRHPCSPTSCGYDDCGTACAVTSCAAGLVCSNVDYNGPPGTCICTSASCPSPGVCDNGACDCAATVEGAAPCQTTLAQTASGSTQTESCVSGCSGSVSGTCTVGVWGTITDTCVPDCPAQSIGTASCPATLPSKKSGKTVSVACPANCSGGPLTATCTNGSWGTVSGQCTCQPNCTGKNCGDSDGCGGTCQTGNCPSNYECTSSKGIASCVAQCTGTLPSGAGLCNTNHPSSPTPYYNADTCPSGACGFICPLNSTYSSSLNSCVENNCPALPPNSKLCVNDKNNFPPNVPPGTTKWSLVNVSSECGQVPCQAHCEDGVTTLSKDGTRCLQMNTYSQCGQQFFACVGCAAPNGTSGGESCAGHTCNFNGQCATSVGTFNGTPCPNGVDHNVSSTQIGTDACSGARVTTCPVSKTSCCGSCGNGIPGQYCSVNVDACN